jgi:hypothetical protein
VLLAEIMFMGINLTALRYLRPALEVKTMSARNIPSVQLTVVDKSGIDRRGNPFTSYITPTIPRERTKTPQGERSEGSCPQ